MATLSTTLLVYTNLLICAYLYEAKATVKILNLKIINGLSKIQSYYLDGTNNIEEKGRNLSNLQLEDLLGIHATQALHGRRKKRSDESEESEVNTSTIEEEDDENENEHENDHGNFTNIVEKNKPKSTSGKKLVLLYKGIGQRRKNDGNPKRPSNMPSLPARPSPHVQVRGKSLLALLPNSVLINASDLPNMAETMTGTFSDIKQKMSDTIHEIKDVAAEIKDRVSETYSDILDKAYDMWPF